MLDAQYEADGRERGSIFPALQELGAFASFSMPEVPEDQRNKGNMNAAPTHGIGVTPDNKLLFSCSRLNSHVYVYSVPDMKLVADIPVSKDPDWITFTPDSKFAYVASAGTDSASVIDIAQKKQVASIPVGKVPKRNVAAMLNLK